jgi:hypothetical protein
MTVDGAYYGDLDTSYYQNIASPAERLATAFVKFSSTTPPLAGSVDEEKVSTRSVPLRDVRRAPENRRCPGRRVRCGDGPAGRLYPQILGTYDVGFQLRITRRSGYGSRQGAASEIHSIRSRSSTSAGSGTTTSITATPGVPDLLRGPGLELNEVGGRTRQAIVEWNLPPVRFLRFGTRVLRDAAAHLAVHGRPRDQLRPPAETTGTPPVN